MIHLSLQRNKYSKEANRKVETEKTQNTKSQENEERPFRMQKINLIWQKAQMVSSNLIK